MLLDDGCQPGTRQLNWNSSHIIDPWFTIVQSETRGFINILCLRPHWHGKVSVNYAKVTEGRLFASPALCHFRKTRTQYFTGRTENNHRTLVGLVGFRAGMKHKSFKYVRSITVRMATCQPHNHLWHRLFIVTSPAGLFAHCAFTFSPVLFQMYPSSFNPFLLFLQRQSTLSPPEQLGYYDIAWGLTKVLQKEVLDAASRLRHRYGVEVRNLNDWSTFRGAKTALWPHALSVHELPTKCHISAFEV